MYTRLNWIRIYCYLNYLFYLVAIGFPKVAGSRCEDKAVCGTLTKRFGEVISDGQICICPNYRPCDMTWNENDRKGFTWQHHSNSRMMVQYRHCDEVVPDRECGPQEENGEVAVLATKEGTWLPFVEFAKCRCTDKTFRLAEWHLKDGLWKYSYTCKHQSWCQEDAPCARYYMNYSLKKSIGTIQMCRCPPGGICSESPREEWLRRGHDPSEVPFAIDRYDLRGQFIYARCRHTRGIDSV